MSEVGRNSDKNSETFSYDEAVELTGHGCYNYLLLVACSVITLAVALEMFGFSVVVAAASCDLNLSITATGLLNSVPLAGIIFAFPWGYYADTQGRHRALLVSTSVGFLLAALTSFAPTWEVMLVLKFLACIFSTAAYTLTMTYLGECTGSARRCRYMFFLNSANLAAELVFYSLAYLILPLDFSLPIPLVGYNLRPWRVYCLLLATPLGIGAFLLIFLHESPKLLASRGKGEKALEVLRIMYKRNGGKKDEYPVKVLIVDEVKNPEESFWRSIVQQTVPLFKPPLLWRTLQLFFLLAICGTTNNVFLMWYPLIVNLFFNSFTDNAELENRSFCDRVISNFTTSADSDYVCDDTIAPKTMYAGMILGLTFVTLNLAASAVARHRRLVLIAAYLLSGICLVSVEVLRQPVINLIAFTLIQCTAIGIGSVASYFVDLYPTAYRGLVTSLGIMFSRLVALTGVNLMGAVIFIHCSVTFYSWTVVVASGIVVALFLPSDKLRYK